MARAIPEEADHPNIPDEHYATITIYVPEGRKGMAIIEEITSVEQAIYKQEFVSEEDGDTRMFKFDCTQPSQMYVVVRVANNHKSKLQVAYPNGAWFYISSASLASNLHNLSQFQRYCIRNNLATVKYRRATAYQFAFGVDDLYLLSKYFAQREGIFGKFYAKENGLRLWKGRRITKIELSESDLI